MTPFDFSNEDDQREYKPTGPVPSGSIVFVRMSLLKSEYSSRKDPLVQLSEYGLYSLYCQFEVVEGSYAGVSWRQSVALPYGMQEESLNENQILACQIGGSLLKAILTACGKSLKVVNFSIFDGLTFPVKVRINKRPSKYEGRIYWKNEISRVILPNMPEYAQVRKEGEIINENGAVVYEEKQKKKSDAFSQSPPPPEAPAYDDVPF